MSNIQDNLKQMIGKNIVDCTNLSNATSFYITSLQDMNFKGKEGMWLKSHDSGPYIIFLSLRTF